MSQIAKLKRFLVGKGMETLLPALSTSQPELLVKMMDRLSGFGIERMKKNHKGTPEELDRRVEAARAFFEMARRKLPSLSRETRRLLALNAFFRAVNLGDEKRAAYLSEHGEYPPFLLLISPTMACDLRCFGCYAWKYPRDAGLSREKVSELVREAKEDMGIHFIAITGGEPTVWPHLEEIAAEHQDAFFMVYTHGQRIDQAMAERFARLGNVYPAVSIEGSEELTDARRGPGTYKRVLEAMDHMNRAGVLFGYSLTHTRLNHEASCSDQFVDEMVAHGAAFGWVFQYIPVGKDPQWQLVPTPEQRLERRERIHQFRREKPILLYDFWNDGDAVDGCIAWGRKYVHVTATGMVEPCVFVHFAKDSVHEKTLGECLRSACFRDARSRQPFGHDRDLRRPCPQIDRPEILKELVEKHGMKGTHTDAEDILGSQYGLLCREARAFADELERYDAARAGAAKPEPAAAEN